MSYPGDLLLHLQSFVLLVTHVRRGKRGAFEQAARDLHVDRSVLRRRIQTLRQWLDVPLLDGRGSDLRPTAAGLRLLERAEGVVATVHELRVDVSAGRERRVIGCTGTVATELVPHLLVALEKRSPPVQLAVRRAGGELCERLVRSGEVDVGVVRAMEPPRGLASRRLVDDRLWFVLPAKHPLARRAKLSIAEMASVPLVLYGESSRTRARVMERLAPHGGTIRVEVEGRSAALAYVAAGIGATFVSLLPGHAVTNTAVRARDVSPLFGRSTFYLIGRKDRWSDLITTAVIDHLLRAARVRASK